MADLESVFIKEFNRAIRNRPISKNIFKVPLPECVNDWDVWNTDMLGIKGIPKEADKFAQLNGCVVKKLPRGSVASKRKVDLVTRDFLRDANNRYVYEDVKVPKGSIVISSYKQLKLPYGYTCPLKGFGYIDYADIKGNREYMYYVPKMYVYYLNQTALVLSVKNMKNYNGKGYLSWDYGTIYLHVIPYKPNAKYVGTKVLKTGQGLGYGQAIRSIVDFWINNDIIPNISLCETNTKGNLVVKDTAVGYETYVLSEELSLGEKEKYGGTNDEKA